MALKREFIGTSRGGNLREAIRDALKQARKEFANNMAWEIKQIAENQLRLGPISVKIRVGQGKGEGGGIGPR